MEENYSEVIIMPRPRATIKTTRVENLEDVILTPAANGYIIQSKSTGAHLYVFPDLDKAFDFIRAYLAPTTEQTEFVKAI